MHGKKDWSIFILILKVLFYLILSSLIGVLALVMVKHSRKQSLDIAGIVICVKSLMIELQNVNRIYFLRLKKQLGDLGKIMTIPKLDVEGIRKYGTAATLDKVVENIHIIREEQSDEIYAGIITGGYVNPNMLYGFIAAYMMIRDAMIKAECNELEKLVDASH
jgi:hypothetical protein